MEVGDLQFWLWCWPWIFGGEDTVNIENPRSEELTWRKAKDSIVVGLAGLVVMLLGLLLKGHIEMNAALMEIKKDIAVIESKRHRDRDRDRMEQKEVSERLALAEKQVFANR